MAHPTATADRTDRLDRLTDLYPPAVVELMLMAEADMALVGDPAELVTVKVHVPGHERHVAAMATLEHVVAYSDRLTGEGCHVVVEIAAKVAA